MQKRILAFGASNSVQSINRKFAEYTAHRITNAEVDLLDLNDFEMPIFSIDRENEVGIPELAHHFKERIRLADGIIISFAEHNGSYTVAFKNIYDWISRIERSVWLDKPMLLLSTAPGPRGGVGVLETAYARYNRRNINEVYRFSLPKFGSNFNSESGIVYADLKETFEQTLDAFNKSL